jgi:hypothetical protein
MHQYLRDKVMLLKLILGTVIGGILDIFIIKKPVVQMADVKSLPTHIIQPYMVH